MHDGLHASKALVPKWADILKKSMELNGMLEDIDDQGPPQRYLKHSTERRGME